MATNSTPLVENLSERLPPSSAPPAPFPSSPPPSASVTNAHVVSLRLLLTAWLTHFRSLGYVKDSTMDLLDRTVCKKTLELTVRDPTARESIGTCDKVWSDLVELIRVALPSLESRTYAPPPCGRANFEEGVEPARGGGFEETTNSGPSSNVMVANSVTLLRDLQRLDSVLAMARNVLTAGEKCQNLAAQLGFDREVCAVVNLCVKVTARGFDGNGQQGGEEERWNAVVNGFKKLLITCLQFLSNLVTMNERLKLMLWVELFDTSSDGGHGIDNGDSLLCGKSFAEKSRTGENWVTSVATNIYMTRRQQHQYRRASNTLRARETSPEPKPKTELWPIRLPYRHPHVSARVEQEEDEEGRPLEPESSYLLFLQEERVRLMGDMGIDQEALMKSVEVGKRLLFEGTKRWNTLPEEQRNVYKERYMADFEQYKKELAAWKAARSSPERQRNDGGQSSIAGQAGNAKMEDYDLQQPSKKYRAGQDEDHRSFDAEVHATYTTNVESWSQPDYQMIETAADGAGKLAEGKSELLKRLEHANLRQRSPPPLVSPSSPVELPLSPIDDADSQLRELQAENEDDEEEDEDEEDEEEDDELYDDQVNEPIDEEESSEDDEYAVPGEDGRGLLTDVPLILGPNEIEVLPMFIMSGIVAPTGEHSQAKNDKSHLIEGAVNMYTIRCHLLLDRENGRNLLRELLIFVAAWDLREEELYFKFMVKIMEAILMNGLMPFAYNAFKESKDIISPAQAVIMKLLTKIFHARQAFIGGPNVLSTPSGNERSPPSAPLRFDIQIVHFLFSEFRQNIIPQICALIFLQGQIRLGFANLEDFPLNLWDMERMYEGVYQYLEFFAILTDHDSWKQLMADWEVTYELVTLLRELEVAIPKGKLTTNLTQPLQPNHRRASMPGRFPSPSPPSSAQTPPPPAPVAVEYPYDVKSPAPANGQIPADIETPLNATPSPYPEQIHDEPADFEWRNLKKLCVLVLSSLVWKNRRLQDQVRDFGGITAILSCCTFDEHNPYIREHAIMCLRFLLEGNKENQDIVRGFSEADKQGTGEKGSVKVPMEVLDSRGYETYMDGKGKVGLRRKEGPGMTAAEALTLGEGELEQIGRVDGRDWSRTPSTLGALPEWMQMVVKNMPSTPK